jgi:hypothetical protein
MNLYSNINEAFENEGHDELDRMAREINNNKKQQIKSVYNDLKNDAYCSKNTVKPFSFFSTQGSLNCKPDFDGTLINDIKKSIEDQSSDIDSESNASIGSETSDQKTFETFEDTRTYDTFMNSLNNYKAEKKTKPNKLMTEVLKHISKDHINDSDSEDSSDELLDHLKHCSECKKKIMNLLKKPSTKHIKLPNELEPIQVPLPVETKPIEVKQFVSEPIRSIKTIYGKEFNLVEVKQIVVALLIGIVIILILDILIKHKSRYH